MRTRVLRLYYRALLLYFQQCSMKYEEKQIGISDFQLGTKYLLAGGVGAAVPKKLSIC